MDILPKFKDMALDLSDSEGDGLPEVSKMPIYPSGLCICLTNEQLDKLDMDGNPEVGDMIHLHAIGVVTSYSERNSERGPQCRVEIQLTHIAAEDEDEENESAEEEMEEPSGHKLGRFNPY